MAYATEPAHFGIENMVELYVSLIIIIAVAGQALEIIGPAGAGRIWQIAQHSSGEGANLILRNNSARKQ